MAVDKIEPFWQVRLRWRKVARVVGNGEVVCLVLWIVYNAVSNRFALRLWHRVHFGSHRLPAGQVRPPPKHWSPRKKQH